MTDVSEFVKDVAVRAGHTLWQTFAAAVAVFWAGAGLHVQDLTTMDAWHKVLVGLIAAATASAASTVKTLAGGAKVVDVTPASVAPVDAAPVVSDSMDDDVAGNTVADHDDAPEAAEAVQ